MRVCFWLSRSPQVWGLFVDTLGHDLPSFPQTTENMLPNKKYQWNDDMDDHINQAGCFHHVVVAATSQHNETQEPFDAKNHICPWCVGYTFLSRIKLSDIRRLWLSKEPDIRHCVFPDVTWRGTQPVLWLRGAVRRNGTQLYSPRE